MSGLSPPRQNGILLLALLFGQLLLMSFSVRDVEGATKLETWTMRISSPVVALAQAVTGGFHRMVSGTRELFDAHVRAATLETEVRSLRSEVQQYREAALENARLRELLEMREQLAPASIGAAVVTAVLTSATRMVVVDRGKRDGVRVDQPVVAWGGAIGRVVAVEPHHAKVLLLADANSGVAGVVQRSRAQGMVFGKGVRPLELLYVPRFSDVALGDRVVTSGLDGIFPRGYGIGVVRSIHEPPDGSKTIELMPQVEYGDLEEVLILLEPIGGGLLEGAELEELP